MCCATEGYAAERLARVSNNNVAVSYSRACSETKQSTSPVMLGVHLHLNEQAHGHQTSLLQVVSPVDSTASSQYLMSLWKNRYLIGTPPCGPHPAGSQLMAWAFSSYISRSYEKPFISLLDERVIE